MRRLYTMDEVWSATRFNAGSLPNVQTPDDAKRYAKPVVTALSLNDVQQLLSCAAAQKPAALRVRRSRRSRRSRKKTTGGAVSDPARFEEMLAALDSLHDFKQDSRCRLSQDVDAAEDVLVALGKTTDWFDPAVRNELVQEEAVHFEAAILRWLARSETVVVDKRRLIRNPLYGLDLLATVTRPSPAQFKRSLGAVGPALRTLSISSGAGSAAERILELKQIARVRGQLLSYYARPHFVLDTYSYDGDLVMKLMIAVQLVTDEAVKQVRLMGADVPVEDAGAYARMVAKYDELAASSWARDVKFFACDANLYDAAEKGFPGFEVDDRPTGSVPQCPSLRLDGVHDGNVRVHISEAAVLVSPALAGEQLSGRSVVAQLLYEDKVPGTSSPPEEVQLTTRRSTGSAAAKGLRAYLAGVDKAVVLGMKRAGDWGQVEHCKKRGRVFVTRDRLAAAYALYRRVPMLFYRNLPQSGGDILHAFVMWKP